MIDSDALDEIADGYIVAALWADAMPLERCAVCREPLAWSESGDVWTHEERPADDHAAEREDPESGGLDHLSTTAESWAYVRHLVAAFAEAAGPALAVFADLRAFDPSEGTVWQYIGHDLRLTSGGHGTGFWDREPEPTNMREGDAERFAEARQILTDLCDVAPFHRHGGGDVFQIDAETVEFDRWPLDPDAPPGARYVAAPLTSAQRQAWIETGRVPDVADTFPAEGLRHA